FHRPVTTLGSGVLYAREHGHGGLVRVQRVGLPTAAPSLTIGTHHLNHLETLQGECPGDPCTVGPSSLHPDLDHVAQASEQINHLPVAGRTCGARLINHRPPELINDRNMMSVLMSVDPGETNRFTRGFHICVYL